MNVELLFCFEIIMKYPPVIDITADAAKNDNPYSSMDFASKKKNATDG